MSNKKVKLRDSPFQLYKQTYCNLCKERNDNEENIEETCPAFFYLYSDRRNNTLRHETISNCMRLRKYLNVV